ncbi:alanyl-tRNA editing protein AlaX-L [Clostridium sp. NSJ-49]|uniref:Alanine--tRNA ligase n=1 Tax=Clostridium disporicum TaxID=84024 RepID=A0A174DEE5_9CLOT|nr:MULTISPECIES: DHHA1 domain-containing protein [Clostridium]MBC5624871.1 alanyl-tRNA editing protein AlaX-L [Clostridium sp. NSJ-49]MDU6340071.1 DHHA1 domain-containing protein [Clostridium sp.]CUO22689.1 threonyl/alanyl tRNA synthetase [Clostridium disporicum]
MEKLYYLDRYIKEFTAEVVEVKEIDGMYHVALDKSAFFPGGGGQPGDTGFIESSKVIDVYEDNGVVYHVLEKKPLKIHRVKCKIDWEKRYDGMQQHLGQHVLSGCFYSLFNANTVSFHMGSESSTVDIEGFLEEDKIREAERFANEIINQNIEVEFFTPSKSELKKIKIRRALPKTDDAITIVKIGDLDINACCGVHPKSTLDLRMIKIKRWEKHKGATRIEFLAGKRAIDDSLRRDSIIATICKSMKCGESEILNIISKSAEEIREYQNENRMLKLELSKYEIKEMIESADKIGDISIIKKIYEKSDLKHIGKLAEKLVENKKTIALFAVKYDDKSNLIFASSKDNDISMNELLKDAITLIDGRGGGSKFLAQGGGKKSNNLEATIDYAFMKIKNSQN